MLKALAATGGERLLTGRSVIFLFLQGGPSQFETFDPKMSAPLGIRSASGEVATSIPGVTFGGQLPKLAATSSSAGDRPLIHHRRRQSRH